MSSSNSQFSLNARQYSDDFSNTFIIDSNYKDELLGLLFGYPALADTLFNIKERINGIIYYPFSIPKNFLQKGTLRVQLGAAKDPQDANNIIITDLPTLIQAYRPSPTGFYMGQLNLSAMSNNFTNFEPYTRIEISLPFYGTVELPCIEVVGKYVQFRLFVDFKTGQAQYVIGVSDTNITPSLTAYPYITGDYDKNVRIISSYTFQLGYPVPIGNTNINELTRTLVQSSVKIGAAVASVYAASAGGLMSTVLTENMSPSKETYTNMVPDKGFQTTIRGSTSYSVEQSGYTKTKTMDETNRMKRQAISTVFGESANALGSFSFKAGSDKPNSSALSGFTPMSIIAYIKKIPIANIEGYAHQFGMPLGEVRHVNEITGFTVFSTFHLGMDSITDIEYNHIGVLTTEEINRIHDLMTSGVYL